MGVGWALLGAVATQELAVGHDVVATKPKFPVLQDVGAVDNATGKLHLTRKLQIEKRVVSTLFIHYVVTYLVKLRIKTSNS